MQRKTDFMKRGQILEGKVMIFTKTMKASLIKDLTMILNLLSTTIEIDLLLALESNMKMMDSERIDMRIFLNLSLSLESHFLQVLKSLPLERSMTNHLRLPNLLKKRP